MANHGFKEILIMQLQAARNLALQIFDYCIKTSHRRLLTGATLVAACFLPTWLGLLTKATIDGSSVPVLNLGFLALGIYAFWQNRVLLLQSLKAESDDRFLGYLLMATGVVGFCVFHGLQKSTSLQAFSVMLTIAGMFGSTWGLGIFGRFPVAIGLFLVSIYPDIEYVAIRVCRFFTSPDMLEQIMAWLGSIGLNLIGFKATAQAAYVTLPTGSVWVGPGCSGFEMVLVLMGTGFLMGRFMQLTWQKTAGLMVFGWALSLIFNIPRIMLLAIASVYWGKQSFDFWHGPIGGQMFAMVLFTVYYYAVMWVIDRKPKPNPI
jgi:exosortase/archaeosortase family protein